MIDEEELIKVNYNDEQYVLPRYFIRGNKTTKITGGKK